MIAIVGSGKFTNFLIRNLDKKDYLLISGTKKKDSKIAFVGENLDKINSLKLPINITHCIINWSHTYINKFSNFKDAIKGFENLSFFIENNPEVNYVFISSTSADSEVNKYSLYGLSKFMAEDIFMKIKTKIPKIKIHIVRLGMIYGLEDCPIRKILSFRKFFTEIYPGKPDSKFAVTAAEDISKYLLNFESAIWQSNQINLGFYEPNAISLEYLQKKVTEYNLYKKSLFKFNIYENKLLINLLAFLGKKIDLSLANINRFPKVCNKLDYKLENGIDMYLKNVLNKKYIT